MLPLVVFTASGYVMFCPPDLCVWWYLARVCVRGKGDGAPPDDLEVLNAFSPYHRFIQMYLQRS